MQAQLDEAMDVLKRSAKLDKGVLWSKQNEESGDHTGSKSCKSRWELPAFMRMSSMDSSAFLACGSDQSNAFSALEPLIVAWK